MVNRGPQIKRDTFIHKVQFYNIILDISSYQGLEG